MESLSLNETPIDCKDADEVCRCVEANSDALRTRHFGTSFRLSGIVFRLFQADRNILYRIKNRRTWYLKMPTLRHAEPIDREIQGARIVRTALANLSVYRHLSAVRTCPDHAYHLAAAVDLRPLNRTLYLAALFRVGGYSTFSALGSALGQLHACQEFSDAPRLKRTVGAVWASVQRELLDADELVLDLDRKAEAVDNANVDAVFTHGNLGMENVLGARGLVTMIDFENSGVGSPYVDLAGICSQLFETNAVPHLSTRSFQQSLFSFLRCYRRQREVKAGLLAAAIDARLTIKYARSFFSGHSRQTVCGWPMSQARFKQLLNRDIAGDITGALSLG